MTAWARKGIRGVLLDITGVLYESSPGGGTAIPGSVEAVKRLKASGLPVRFCTNETTITRRRLVEKLARHGFTVDEKDVFPPIPAMCKLLKERNLRPHLLVCPEALPDFADIDQSDPNCVILGDAQDSYSYDNLNTAFQRLMAMDSPILFSLGKGKFYREKGELVLDVGVYAKALEYACDIEAEIVGKPSKTFYTTALNDMGISADECVMIGDDIVSDVGGAQAAGMRGIQVRTGKFRPQDENHPTVKPDGFVDNLAMAVDLILEQQT